MKFATVYPFRVPEEKIMCLYCKDSFEIAVKFRAHMQREHEKLNKSLAFKYVYTGVHIRLDCSDVKCRICNNAFLSLDAVAKHLKGKHGAKLILDGKVLQALPYIFDNRSLKCGICFSTFSSYRTLGRHFSSHFPNYSCNTCSKTFIETGTLNKHAIFCNQKEKFLCLKCLVPFATLEERVKHQEENIPCRQYCCTKCDERFLSYYSRNKHLLDVHKVTCSALRCTVCNEVFSSSDERKKHFRLAHPTLCKFICQHCSKPFHNQSNLNDHLTIHTGEKPYKCDDCKKTFATKRNLTQHSWMHKDTKRFECKPCERQFNQRISWRTHMRNRHPELGIT